MKKTNFFLMTVSAILTFSSTMAQKDSSGIYNTASDFQQQKLSYAINYKTEKHKINDNLLFKDAEIKVKHDGKTYLLNKDNTYGYRSTKGEDFRFVNRKAYKILNPGESLIIYAYWHPSNSTKGTIHFISDYYFSTDASSIPLALTKGNLKTAFPTNHKFHDALDTQFRSDEELYVYDDFHKVYKLNRIYDNSK